MGSAWGLHAGWDRRGLVSGQRSAHLSRGPTGGITAGAGLGRGWARMHRTGCLPGVGLGPSEPQGPTTDRSWQSPRVRCLARTKLHAGPPAAADGGSLTGLPAHATWPPS